MSLEKIGYYEAGDFFIIDGQAIKSGEIAIILTRMGFGGARLGYNDKSALKPVDIPTREGTMCNLSNQECKELSAILKSFQNYNCNPALEMHLKYYLEMFEPFVKKCDEGSEEGTEQDEYDPQF